MSFSAKGFPYASLELLEATLGLATTEESSATVHDAIGLISVGISQIHDALEHFITAVRKSYSDRNQLRYQMHEAMAYGYLSQHDRAQRLLTHLVAISSTSDLKLHSRLCANLAVSQAYNEFYREALENTCTALGYARETHDRQFEATLLNNLGHLQIELGAYKEAEHSLLRALELFETPPLPTLTELGRLYLAQEQYDQCVVYAQQAVRMVWSSILNYEREEIARLCNLLAHLAYHLGELNVALRLLEKSQLLFGQLSMWSQWQQAQSLMDSWRTHPKRYVHIDSLYEVDLDGIREFLFLFDAMNAQELTHRAFSALTDTRVQTVQALCSAMGVPEEDMNDVIYAARFADYGLTALEPEVIENPYRSAYALQQYQQHPDLSIRMLQVTTVPARVLDIIRDHHEHWDGSGFPSGKREGQITPLAQVLAAADVYATEIVQNHKRHSAALQTVEEAAGHILSPGVVQSFTRLFNEI
ncbi:HD domain-containing phosphohydrolase [Alicyclobacillus cycloheptanicus]|nr:HD domain-containing phosphohydrolase [Alicyclobacillus cycloheptanicus]